MTELLDIYNKSHQKIRGGVPRAQAPKLIREGEYFLICHICIFSPAGRMLVQKRVETKEVAPGRYDVSAGGFTRTGETSKEAVLREAREELGYVIPTEKLAFVNCFPFSYVLDDFYLAAAPDDRLPDRLQAEEVAEVRWMEEAEILAGLADGSFVDYDPEVIRHMFAAFRQHTDRAGLH